MARVSEPQSLVISGPDGEEDPHYCAECVHEALRWCAQPGAGERGRFGGADDG